MQRLRITDESINSYGFWVLTSGGDLTGFVQNPVLLYDHDRQRPIGILKDIIVATNGEITGVPEFDEEDKFAASISRKYQKGHLRAASMGFTVLEWSEAPTFIKPGQARPTVTKWTLKEVSITTVPSNRNAVQLYDLDGNAIQLSDTGDDAVPLLTLTSKPKQLTMEMKPLATLLSLSDTATMADIELATRSLIDKLNVANDKIKALETARAQAIAAEVDAEIQLALKDGRLTEDQTASWRKLFAADHESALASLKSLTPVQKLKDFPSGGKEKLLHEGKTFEELERDNPETLKKLKQDNPAMFQALYDQSRYARKAG